MGYKVNFLDNQSVAATDLNSLATELGGGALSFTDDTLYGVEDLNKISSSLIGKGVSWGCGLSVRDGKVVIGNGVVFMADGKRVEIDAEGVALSYKPGVLNYVWLHHDSVTGFVVPCCTQEEPSGTDYVLLGLVTAEGSITGRPDRAIMKNSFLGLNKTETHTLSLGISTTIHTTDGEELFAEIIPTQEGYQYLLVTGSSSAAHYNDVCGMVHLATGEAYGIMSHCMGRALYLDKYPYSEVSSNTEGRLFVCWTEYGSNDYRTMLRFSLDSDNVLRVYRTTTLQHGGWYGQYGVNLTLRLC
ncbi:MAG: hypothetical protein E7414_05890 [Ruminococcaceae bacterium]|nr:hypothetical protein [Oscillospiraceae bacterium]